MVGDPLVIASQQCDIDGALDPAGPVIAEDHPELFAAQFVHHLVIFGELPGVFEVALGQHPTDIAHHVLGDPRHLPEVVVECFRHRVLRVSQSRDLGHMRRQIAHPPQRGHHLDDRDQGAQLAGHRRLPRQDGECAHFELVMHHIDAGVPADDPFSQLQVGIQ